MRRLREMDEQPQVLVHADERAALSDAERQSACSRAISVRRARGIARPSAEETRPVPAAEHMSLTRRYINDLSLKNKRIRRMKTHDIVARAIKRGKLYVRLMRCGGVIGACVGRWLSAHVG